jgi:hypothetical protein
MKKQAKEALAHLRRAQELAKRMRTGLEGMTKEGIIAKIRKTRMRLWEEKLALRS